MMLNPFFSIIVPVYNIEKYIEECVDSLLNQEGVDYEIILVDDGSTDGSGEICDRYAKGNHVVKVYHEDNAGPSVARNKGVELALGKYILFVDGDDFIAKNCLQNIKRRIEKQNYPDLLLLDVDKLFTDNKTVSMGYGYDETINTLSEVEINEFLANLNKFPASPVAKAINREFYNNSSLMFEKGQSSEDYDWTMKLFLSKKTCGYLSGEFYFYRQLQGNSRSGQTSDKKSYDMLCVVEKWLDYAIKEKDIQKRQMIVNYMEYMFRFVLIGYLSVGADHRQDYRKRIKNCEWIFGNRKDNNSKTICMTYKMLGTYFTAIVLKRYLRFRDR